MVGRHGSGRLPRGLWRRRRRRRYVRDDVYDDGRHVYADADYDDVYDDAAWRYIHDDVYVYDDAAGRRDGYANRRPQRSDAPLEWHAPADQNRGPGLFRGLFVDAHGV